MMLTILFMILVLTFVTMALIGVISSLFSNDNIVNSEGFLIVTFTVGIIAIITTIFVSIDSRNPTAMDVYRGKATIAITYADGVPVDSTVVFKKGNK